MDQFVNYFSPGGHFGKITIALLLSGFALISPAQSVALNENSSPPALFEKIWDSATLYNNPENPVLQSFSLVGRYHGQYWSVDADQGKADGWDNRRIIFGFQTALYEDFLFEVQMHVNESLSPVYKGLYVGFLKWAPKDTEFSASLGRLDYVYTGMERTTSSKKISTFERGLLVNQLMPGEVFGLYGTGKIDAYTVQAGLFTGATKEEFGDFNSGFASTLGVEHALPLFFDQGELHLDFLYNDSDQENTSFKPYRNVVSLWHQGRLGPFSMGIDISGGDQGLDGQSNVWGLTLLPGYEFAHNLLITGDALQWVLRYHYAKSSGFNGLLLPKRYEQEVATGTGDHYQAFYLGINYFLNDDKLKVMAGAEYARMKDSPGDGGDYMGWTYLAGLRLYF